MKVKNMLGRTGKPLANQFIIEDVETTFEFRELNGIKRMHIGSGTMFQSYETNIAFISGYDGRVYLDKDSWNYSVIINKYRNLFLHETRAETGAKINSGEYVLTDLN